MEWLVGPFIQNPSGIFLVSGLFFTVYLLTRSASFVSNPKALLWPATAWALWAIWELIIMKFSPEANIRVDLLLIIPILVIVMGYGLYSALVSK